jgi:hypothetical protein
LKKSTLITISLSLYPIPSPSSLLPARRSGALPLSYRNPHSSSVAVPDVVIRRQCSFSYMWIPTEVIYSQHFEDRTIRSDQGCVALTCFTRFRSYVSSGIPRGFLPQVVLGSTTWGKIMFISLWPNSRIIMYNVIINHTVYTI